MFIAEIGINHDGDIDKAIELIRISKECNVDIVKFQKRNPKTLFTYEQQNEIKDSIFGKIKYIDYKELLEFGKKEYDIIDKYCKDINIKWTASIWDEESLHFISKYNIPFIKIPSARCNDYKLLKEINILGLPIVLSNGGITNSQLDNAIKQLNNIQDISILQCNANYPSKNNELDIKHIIELKDKYPNYKIGYSGHEQGYIPTLVASSIGADIIERHITLDKNSKGSDHKASLEPHELKELMYSLSVIKDCLGSKDKIVYESEKVIINKLSRINL